MPELITEPYNTQHQHWPQSGRHIMAQYDDEAVVVYQAYNRHIGRYAAEEDLFYGAPGFKMDRMTWIKPNFLWMMHRCGWATKPDQEMVLAIWLDRVGFDAILRKAVISSFDQRVYDDEAQWKQAVGASSVRVQWDPDYGPGDNWLERRALQLGLRGKAGNHYANGGWILHIEDITPFVHEQRENAKRPYDKLLLPKERPYPVYNEDLAWYLGIDEA